MKTLYLTRTPPATDLSNYYTQGQVDAAFAPITRPRTNKLINGCHRVWQRAASYTGITSGSYVGDHWRFYKSTSAVFDVTQESTGAGDGLPFSRYTQFNTTTADGFVGATDYANIVTAVEGADSTDMMFGMSTAKEITLSFWHKHSMVGTFCVAIRNSATDRYYIANYTQAVTDTWEKAEITLTADTTGTWLYTRGTIGLQVTFSILAGSNFDGTEATWSAGSKVVTSGQVNGANAVNYKFCLGGCKLEVGGEATDYVERPIGEELALARRYYEKSYAYDEYAGDTTYAGGSLFRLTGIATAVHDMSLDVRFEEPKAKTPTVVTYSGTSATANRAYDFAGAGEITTTLSIQSNNGFKWSATAASANNVNVICQWTASAEII